MRKLYFVILSFSIAFTAQSQIINFTNANLKERLLSAAPFVSLYAKDINGNYVQIDTNSNGEIEVSEALTIYWLNVGSCDTDNLNGIEYFTNLRTFHCSYNPITTLGNALNGMTNLQTLIFDSTLISNVDQAIALHPGLISINANYNPNLTTIDLSGLHELQYLYLDHCNNLMSVDVSSCYGMSQMWLDYCPNLQSLNIKNGVDEDCTFGYCPSLHYICCDDIELSDTAYRATWDAASGCVVNGYCSINPGGQFYIINGSERFDIDSNGCGTSDPFYRNLKFTLSSTTTYNTFFGDATGHHTFGVGTGTYTFTPVLENPTYFTVSPTSTTVTFPTQASPFTQDFCVTANGIHPDLEITLLPINVARPGFDVNYKIIYKNKGNQTQSGSVNLTFDDAVLDFVSANPISTTQTTNNLSWDFTNLLPFEAREIELTLNVNSPMETPAVNGGDILDFISTIISPATDEKPYDNTITFHQMVVNSFDPNDKTCLEGTTISPEMVGEYVHYVIRFENTGTYPAENIVVKDMIDLAKFDINTLVPIKGSHEFLTNITAGNKVEFFFENINLPFDDETNDGFVAFKIKTKSNLVVGNTFRNSASIYFDYNFPIVTNTATTTVQALSVKDFEFSNYFSLYPNPVATNLNIAVKEAIEVTSITIYNTLGQLVIAIPNAQTVSNIDVSSLNTGNYFIKINSDKGTSNTKFIKN